MPPFGDPPLQKGTMLLLQTDQGPKLIPSGFTSRYKETIRVYLGLTSQIHGKCFDCGALERESSGCSPSPVLLDDLLLAGKAGTPKGGAVRVSNMFVDEHH